MQVLVLGGTAWLGGHVAASALADGHDVTCVARGVAGTVPPGTRLVRADRDRPDALDDVAAARWDVVVDVSRQPGQVHRAADALAGRCDRFVFVSSASVYADHGTPRADETAPLLPPLAGEVMASMDVYGEAKVACERYVLDAVGAGRSVVARAGLIGGPGDVSDRTGYWPWRFARPAAPDGRVLVPDAPDEPTQVVDVRDLAAWLVRVAADGGHGVFNAMGPTVPLAEHLATARAVAGHTGDVVPAASGWLAAHGVEPWAGERSLPLWIGDPGWAGFSARSSERARAAGLLTRPLADTLTDTLAWELDRAAPSPRRAGLPDDVERTLLAELGEAGQTERP